jgi:alkylation response protein AidB-like acyl-CoA dehydrogenase
VRTRPLASIDPTRQFAAVVLDDVAVEPDRVLAEPGALPAAAGLRGALQEATVAVAAEMVGTCQTVFDIVLAYVAEREQFGVKIGSFQAIKHKVANMYVALESARATVYFAAAAIAEDDERRTMAVSMAKASVADCQKLVAQEGIQCLGGIGYTWEHDMHLYVKRLKAGAATFGTGAEHRATVAGLLGML